MCVANHLLHVVPFTVQFVGVLAKDLRILSHNTYLLYKDKPNHVGKITFNYRNNHILKETESFLDVT